jgi:hypothetical protein
MDLWGYELIFMKVDFKHVPTNLFSNIDCKPDVTRKYVTISVWTETV